MALSTNTSGDTTLINAAKTALTGGYRHHASVCSVSMNVPANQWWSQQQPTVRYATFGSNLLTRFAIASISKVFVGHLFADAIARGEVTPNQLLHTLLPLPSDGPGSVMLAHLATHTAGMPHSGGDHSTGTTREILLQRTIDHWEGAGEVDEYEYSSLGASLLGHALAEAAGTPYKTLVQQRIFDPMGMTAILATTPSDIPAGTAKGYNNDGSIAGFYVGYEYAPSAGVYASVTDMATWAVALLSDNAPGMDAIETMRRPGEPGYRIGWHWHGKDDGWRGHSGSVSGFRTSMRMNLAAKRAVVVLSDTETDVAGAADKLLANGSIFS